MNFWQVVFGHGRQLWGLAVHPDDEIFATAGHDKNIALWRKNKLIWVTQVSRGTYFSTKHLKYMTSLVFVFVLDPNCFQIPKTKY